MGKYLDIACRVEREMAAGGYAVNDLNDKRGRTEDDRGDLPRINRLSRTLSGPGGSLPAPCTYCKMATGD